MKQNKILKRIVNNALAIGFCSLLFLGSAMAEEAPAKYNEENIAPGVMHESYSWSTNYGDILFEVLKCDLNNQNLDLRLVAGGGEYARKATVSSMATATGATAMVNGDFFNMALEGAPIGPSIINGALASSPAVIEGIYSLGIDSSGTAHIEAMAYNGSVTAADGASFPIDGLNKTYYWHDPSGAESHTNLIQMYNDMWGSSSRGHSTNTEVLVNADGIVEQISYGETFPYEVPDNKIILQVNGNAETFVKQHCPIGSKLQIVSEVIPDRDWTFLVGGHALLTNNGNVVPYTKDISSLAGVRARTAAGISADGKTLWIVCAEGRTNRSVGAHLSTLGYFMQYLGADRSLNLDGGGSTTMVLKHVGENNYSTVVAPESFGAMRAVVNGIGIYNSAPIGDVASFKVSGADTIAIGESTTLSVSKVMDDNAHALPVDNGFSMSSVNNLGSVSGMSYVALKAGEDTIRVSHTSGVSVDKKITVQGAEAYSSIRIERDKFMVGDGDSVNLKVYATKKNGGEVLLDPRVVQWSVEGFSGSVESGVLSVAATNDAANGYVTATLGQLNTKTVLGSTSYNLIDLYVDDTSYWLNGNVYTLDQPPVIKNSRTMVPLRVVTEALGGEVEWYDKDDTIAIDYQGHHMKLTVGSKTVVMDGKTLTTDTAPQIVKSRTLVPIRFISEQMGMDVEYDAQTRCVSICTKK